MPRGTYQGCVEMAKLEAKMRRTTHEQKDTGNENESVGATPALRTVEVHQIDRHDEEDGVEP
jgi:hypothetical protein